MEGKRGRVRSRVRVTSQLKRRRVKKKKNKNKCCTSKHDTVRFKTGKQRQKNAKKTHVAFHDVGTHSHHVDDVDDAQEGDQHEPGSSRGRSL